MSKTKVLFAKVQGLIMVSTDQRFQNICSMIDIEFSKLQLHYPS